MTGTCNNDPSAPCATALDCIDDVTRNNMKASDFFFIGIGLGVLLAGVCTLMPGNPFHPAVDDKRSLDARPWNEMFGVMTLGAWWEV